MKNDKVVKSLWYISKKTDKWTTVLYDWNSNNLYEISEDEEVAKYFTDCDHPRVNCK